ncbi:uncharacterized protein [Watersipora subatra]|uniref:uncharacterized protein n=1 Tax=Watersipora subatra TaxID=2589382 RepID=UPI00355AFB91
MDPDYEQYGQASASTTEISKEASEGERISEILQTHIAEEIAGLQSDINETDKRLNETQLILDRLRAAMLISFYNRAENKNDQTCSDVQQGIHPAVKKEIGKSIPVSDRPENFKPVEKLVEENKSIPRKSNVNSEMKCSRGKSQHRVVVGNVSKYIPIDMRQRNDQSSHKWMVYVRGPREHPDISHFVKKVWFFLHPTYKPNDLVEVTSPPFHLTRRGWGEFPVRVQLHLKDEKGRKVDVIHHLKLDSTYSGEQHLGAETHVDVEVEPADTFTPTSKKIVNDECIPAENATAPVTTQDTTIRHSSPKKRANETETSTEHGSRTQRIKLDPPDPESRQSLNISKPCQGVTPSAGGTIRVKQPKLLATLSKSSANNNTQGFTKKTQTSFPIGISTANGVHPSPKVISLLRPRLPVRPGGIEVKRSDVRMKGAQSLLRHNSALIVSAKVLDKSIDSQNTSGMLLKTGVAGGVGLNNSGKMDNHRDMVTSRAGDSTATQGHAENKKPPAVYVKCKLPNGTIMLVRKHVLDQAKQKQLQNDKNSFQQKSNVSEGVDSAQKPCLPSAEFIEDAQTLLTRLVKVFPLLCSPTSPTRHYSQLPTFETYSSWPVGKRRALEWQRAKQIKEHMKSYKDVPGISLWTTKNVLIWCRRYLYTPCCPEDRLLPLPSGLIHLQPATNIESLADDLLNEKRVSRCSDADEPVDMTDTAVRAPAQQHSQDTCRVALVSNEEDEFMRELAGQAGVSLGYTDVDSNLSSNATSYVLGKLYKNFMEQLLRSSHAAIESGSDSVNNVRTLELRPDHVRAAIADDKIFAFLMDVFV